MKRSFKLISTYGYNNYITPTQRKAIQYFIECNRPEALLSPRISFEFSKVTNTDIFNLKRNYDEAINAGNKGGINFYIKEAEKAHKVLNKILADGCDIYKMIATSNDGKGVFYFAVL